MLSSIELVIHVMVAVMTPFALLSLIKGSSWPENAVSKYYRAEPRLWPVSNLLIVVVGLYGLTQLAVRFGLIGVATANSISMAIGIGVIALSVFLIALGISAIRKARRLTATASKM